MTTDYAAIKDKVDELLAAAQITFAIRYVGETTKSEGRDTPWQCDAWRFTLKGNGRQYDGDYFTGLGHRKPVKGAPSDKGNPRTLYREDWEKRYLKPEAPRAADVLHSLLLDGEADGMSFREWAETYGYSDDSITALETYRQCCNAGAELRRIFKRETLEALREAVQEL